LNHVDIALSPETATVVAYCRDMKRNEIVVNRQWQRNDKIWPLAAQSFLIESLLLGYPIPKITLRQLTDVETRQTYREIVDGQQRSEAIRAFYDDRLRLSDEVDTDELRGKKLSELDAPYQERFLNYRLAVDVFIGADDDEVRETFRRMNSYMVPLNPEEQRHAIYQGPFKWFVHRLAKRYDSRFLSSGVFKEKALLRMQDMKLLTELSHAYFHGIQTTNKNSLANLYKRFERAFPEESELESKLGRVLDQLFSWNQIDGSDLMKPFMVYSLLLAIMRVQGSLSNIDVAPAAEKTKISGNALANLTELSEDFSNREDGVDPEFPMFVSACVKSTNTRLNRMVRFQYFYRALTDQMDAPLP
jgi:hypothetical protein